MSENLLYEYARFHLPDLDGAAPRRYTFYHKGHAHVTLNHPATSDEEKAIEEHKDAHRTKNMRRIIKTDNRMPSKLRRHIPKWA